MEKSTHIFTTIKIPKESSKCIFLPVLLVNSVWKTNICKYFQKNVNIFLKKKRSKNILDYELINSFANEETSSKEDSGQKACQIFLKETMVCKKVKPPKDRQKKNKIRIFYKKLTTFQLQPTLPF